MSRTQNVSEQNQKHFLCPGHKICFRNKCCVSGQTGKHLCRQQCVLVCQGLNKMMVKSQVLLSSNFFQTISFNTISCQGLQPWPFRCFRHAFFISGILKVAAQNVMKSRSRDGLVAKGRAYSSYPTKAEFNNC